MAELDWTVLNDSLDAATVDRGVTAGITPPPGGGSFIFGFNSLDVAQGASALKVSPQVGSDFDPLLKGGRIIGAIKRGASPGNTGWSPFMFIGAQGNSVNDLAYMLGLEDNSPYRIVLRKATIVSGIPVADAANSLRIGSESFQLAEDLWHHLRLDMVVNLTGDVVLNVFFNDLTAQPIGDPPVWEDIPGMPPFIDDSLGINSGSAPYLDGRVGFGMQVSDSTRRGFFDHIEIAKQL